MELIKKFFADKSKIAILSVCLLMLSVAIVSAMTGETMAASTYTVSFSAQGGVASKSSMVVLAGATSTYGAADTLATAKRDGYDFSGWYSSAGCSGTKVTDTTILVKQADHTLYACWTSNSKITVTYNSNNGKFSNGFSTYSIEVDKGEEINVYKSFKIDKERTGYKFLGWAKSSSATGAYYSSSKTYSFSNNVVLYAVWEPQKYTIKYDANGGTGAPSDQIKIYNSNLKLSETIPIREGYEFLGWSTSNSATTATYVAGDTYTTSKDTTLYAVWRLSSYKVIFDGNGGTPSKTEMEIKMSATTYGTLPTATRDGYNFVGWFSAKEGGTKVSSNSTLLIGSAHTLYAQWIKKDIIYIFLDSNGGVCTVPSLKFDGIGNHTLNLPEPTREGYRFDGWYTEATGGNKVANGPAYLSSSDTYYAHWTARQYEVTLDVMEGSLSSSKLNVTYNSKYGNLPVPSRDGYKFVGWFDQKIGGNQITGDSLVKTASNHTLYAHWGNDNTAIVTFNTNYGTITSGKDTLTIVPSATAVYNTFGSFPVVSRSGYTFDGWYTTLDNSGYKVTASSIIAKQTNHTLYAHWTMNSYTITFDGNKGIASKSTLEIGPNCSTYNACITLPTASRSGYKFLGWYTAASGGTKVVDSSMLVKKGDHTLYAHWDEIVSSTTTKYTISYNANGGKGAPSSQTKTKGTTLTLRTGVPTRDGYEFLGWSKSSNATTATYESGDSYTTNASATLYAVWVADEYTITYNANGGTGTMSNSNYTYGVANALSDNTFTKEGSTFKCWNTKADGTGINYADKQSITIAEDLTLYAQWTSDNTSSGSGDGALEDSGNNDVVENKIVYYVKYNANGGTGSMNDDEHLYNFAKSLSKNIFTKIGYKFNGWNTKADGTGNSYADGSTVSNLTSTKGATVTLYAQWILDIISGDEGETGDSGTGSGENNEYPIVNLTLYKAYETKLDLAVNIENIIAEDNTMAEIYLIPMEGTGFETGSSYVIDTIKDCKNGKNISTITDLKPDTKYTFQVVLLTENGSVLGKEYVTFKTEPKKSIIENITESPQTGMLATILVSLICIGSLGGLMYYRKKVNNNI